MRAPRFGKWEGEIFFTALIISWNLLMFRLFPQITVGAVFLSGLVFSFACRAWYYAWRKSDEPE